MENDKKVGELTFQELRNELNELARRMVTATDEEWGTSDEEKYRSLKGESGRRVGRGVERVVEDDFLRFGPMKRVIARVADRLGVAGD